MDYDDITECVENINKVPRYSLATLSAKIVAENIELATEYMDGKSENFNILVDKLILKANHRCRKEDAISCLYETLQEI